MIKFMIIMALFIFNPMCLISSLKVIRIKTPLTAWEKFQIVGTSSQSIAFNPRRKN
jgi:hypothetical protein